jgi:hypothetical protein
MPTTKYWTSGRSDIYAAINQLERIKKEMQPDNPHRESITEVLKKLYRGQWLNEEQLKAMYHLGYRDGETTGWLDDDFD